MKQVSIAIDPKLLEKMTLRHKVLDMTRSQYVRALIRADLATPRVAKLRGVAKALLFLLFSGWSLAAGPITGIGLQDGHPVEFQPPPDLGTTPAKTEVALNAAIALGGSVLVPNVEITLTHPLLLTKPGTWLHGLGPQSCLTMGPGALNDVDRIIHPRAQTAGSAIFGSPGVRGRSLPSSSTGFRATPTD